MDNNNYNIIEEPYNPTDVYVVFDPELPKPHAAQTLKSEEEDPTTTHESTKTDGYDVPIVVINQQTIPANYIENFELRYEKFTPTLELTINDNKNEVQFIGGPGLHNYVIVILCPNVEGLYRSISCAFYIKERINLTETQIKYVCEYHNVDLYSVDCKQIGSKQLTTYEFCEEIAKTLKLGFACTEKCKDISDSRWRQMYSQRMKDFIEEQVNIGGLDEDSFFDCWIDTHGYINLVNLSWVLNHETVKPENLTIAVQNNVEVPVNSVKENDPFITQRTITNFETWPISSLKVSSHYAYLNTSKARDMGTDTSFWCLKSAGDQNILECQDVKMIENTIEGQKQPEEYTFRKVEFAGCEMSEDSPYMMQEITRKYWIKKRESKQMTVTLLKPNFGLERGTLINLGIFERNPAIIRQISQNYDNSTESNQEEPGNGPVVDDTKPPMDLGDASSGDNILLNPTMTSMYYINGMMYNYSKNDGKITQVLFLINKNEAQNQLYNSVAAPNRTSEQVELVDTNGTSASEMNESSTSTTLKT